MTLATPRPRVMVYPVERSHVIEPGVSCNVCARCGDHFPWAAEGCVELGRIDGKLASHVPTGTGWPADVDVRSIDLTLGRYDIDGRSQIRPWRTHLPPSRWATT